MNNETFAEFMQSVKELVVVQSLLLILERLRFIITAFIKCYTKFKI
jgi:hypothetical protein